MKRGKDACVTPRLNARRFEQMIVDKIRSNILTEGSITELVKAVDEEMDGIAGEQRKRLKTIEDELEDVKRRVGRIWNAIETSDIDIADASDGIKEHRERKERLEDAAADARAILSQRRAYLDDVGTIAAYANDMKDFLEESELTERRSFIESFVKEIIVIPGDALIRYTVPMPDDSFLAGRAAEKVPLDASVLSTVHVGPPVLGSLTSTSSWQPNFSRRPIPSCYTHLMWGSFALTVVAGVVVLAIGFAGGLCVPLVPQSHQGVARNARSTIMVRPQRPHEHFEQREHRDHPGLMDGSYATG